LLHDDIEGGWLDCYKKIMRGLMNSPGAATDVFEALTSLTHRWQAARRDALADLDLVPGQDTMLVAISADPGVSQSALAMQLDITPTSVAAGLAGLERRGLLRRSPHPTDGRARCVRLTEAGVRAARAAERRQQALGRLVVAGRNGVQRDELLGWVHTIVEACDHHELAAGAPVDPKLRDRILRAAREVFASNGTSAALAAVARRAGVTPVVLRSAFPSRAALHRALFEQRSDEVVRVIESLGGEDPWSDLATVFRALVEIVIDDWPLVAALRRSAHDLGAMAGGVLALDRLVDRCRAAGVVRDDLRGWDLPLLAASVGVTNPDGLPLSRQHTLRYAEIILAGLRA
jgi:DNA-binding MarR family transcriptional regulator